MQTMGAQADPDRWAVPHEPAKRRTNGQRAVFALGWIFFFGGLPLIWFGLSAGVAAGQAGDSCQHECYGYGFITVFLYGIAVAGTASSALGLTLFLIEERMRRRPRPPSTAWPPYGYR